MFMVNQNKSPWIFRTGPSWDDDLIDFSMLDAKIIGNAAPTIAERLPPFDSGTL